MMHICLLGFTLYILTEMSIFLIRSARNSVAPAPQRPAITGGVTYVEVEDRTCCEKAWHCDKGDWYKPCGKGAIIVTFFLDIMFRVSK